MKFHIAFAVLFLICGAQARAVEGDIKEQLKIFIDFLETTIKPVVTEPHRRIEQIIIDVQESAKEDLKKIRVKRAAELLDWMDKDELKKLADAAIEMSTDNTFDCGSIISGPILKYGWIIDTMLEQCVQSNLTKFLQPLNKTLVALDETFVVFDNQVEVAKKCVDDATLSTSFSATECLMKAVITVDTASLEASKQVDFIKLNEQYYQFMKELDQCEQPEAYEKVKTQIHKAQNGMRNCFIRITEGKAVRLTDRDFWHSIDTNPEEIGYERYPKWP
ncbi:uncharacterized protein LOC106656463 isoform X2 [Trichogramma pretiosum]|uniref:uncharacterized protein LOC106656463 isoform X2 n=1 Tax=Trichogramma pretiosum TaxID=7493 RepID=UPI0006C99550|nr:uncharacterized protein LOC106656463 isoform X2 [Trichogramma pretiosum]